MSVNNSISIGLSIASSVLCIKKGILETRLGVFCIGCVAGTSVNALTDFF